MSPRTPAPDFDPASSERPSERRDKEFKEDFGGEMALTMFGGEFGHAAELLDLLDDMNRALPPARDPGPNPDPRAALDPATAILPAARKKPRTPGLG